MVKKNAFTFVEVLIALLVLAVSMYFYADLQTRAIRKVQKSANTIERIFHLKKYLYQLYLAPPTGDKPLKIVMEDPEIIITANKEEIHKRKSELAPFANEIDIIVSDGKWLKGPLEQTVKMISFVPKKQEDEK